MGRSTRLESGFQDKVIASIKEVKTEASKRVLPLSEIAIQYLIPKHNRDFILGKQSPYSYQKVRSMCERIKRETGFDENITPIRFRTTVLTDIYDKTKDIKLAQYVAGHTTPAMTLKHYVKGREGMARGASVIDTVYQ